MITVRKASDRGHTKIDWLDSNHTFSFGHYYDPTHMGFGKLRVINDDTVSAGGGFATHGHQDMEIISYVVDGALEHKDSIGTGSVIKPGDIQRMSAGTGIRHSEFNHSDDNPVRFLQIWIEPDTDGIDPSYEQVHVPFNDRRGQLRLVGSRDGAEGGITIHQDVRLYAGVLTDGDVVEHSIPSGRKAWLQVVEGDLDVNGQALSTGDGAAVENLDNVRLKADGAAEVLLFDLAA